MFYEVKIFNAKGKLKNILSSKELSHRYWKKITDQEKGFNPGSSKAKSFSSEMRRQLDALTPEFLPH